MNWSKNRRAKRPTRPSPPSSAGTWEAQWAAILAAPRVVVLGLVIILVFAGLLLRLWQIQFVEGAYYRERATRQSTREVTIPASRGIIYDRQEKPLVRNIPSFNVVVVPGYLPDDEAEQEDELIRLAMMLGVPYATSGPRGAGEEPTPGLREILSASNVAGSYVPIVIARDVDRDTALLVAQQSLLLPGVSVEVEAVREYPYGPLVAQILGYLSRVPEESEDEYRAAGYDPATDRIGVAGIEYTYEDNLRGQKGRQIVEDDVLGRIIRVIAVQADPVPGQNVHLTIDLDLQRFAEEALRAAMESPEVAAPRGVVIVMNPQTGEVYAMVSLPTYDNNLFTGGISALDWNRLANDPHRPMLNHATADLLPPGSVFKVIVASAALEEGVLTPYTHITCPGIIVVPNKYSPNDPGQSQEFYCWKRSGHGSLDVIGGIAHSCDVFFYETGGGFEETGFEGLGVTRIAEYARWFGLGQPTGIELPAEVAGLVPTADWKRLTFGESWSTGDTYNLSIGQGFLQVTPLQMLNAVNAIANDGILYRPQIVHHVTDAEGNIVEPFEPEVIRRVPVSSENLALVRQGMEAAVAYGTAPKAQLEGIRVAGKTGTAQFCDDIMCGVGFQAPEHAWFTAYAPAEAPEISVIVFLYNGGEGSVAAVPVAHDILAHYFGLDATNGEQ